MSSTRPSEEACREHHWRCGGGFCVCFWLGGCWRRWHWQASDYTTAAVGGTAAADGVASGNSEAGPAIVSTGEFGCFI